MPPIIDSHVHLDFAAFDNDRDQAMRRAEAVGVQAFVVPGITRQGWEKTANICEKHLQCFPAFGLHPYFIDQHKTDDLKALRQWLEKHKPVAVGECGLDYYLKDLDRQTQREIFTAQLKIARDFDLPVIIHSRKSVDDVTKFIKLSGVRKGVMHSFNGSRQQAKILIELGFLLGFGGPITYPRARKLRTLVSALPLESLLLETDAPDQPVCGHQGERNEPARLRNVLEALTELRPEGEDEIAKVTRSNTIRLFNLPF